MDLPYFSNVLCIQVCRRCVPCDVCIVSGYGIFFYLPFFFGRTNVVSTADLCSLFSLKATSYCRYLEIRVFNKLCIFLSFDNDYYLVYCERQSFIKWAYDQEFCESFFVRARWGDSYNGESVRPILECKETEREKDHNGNSL